jgi:hypothetical protein
MPIRFRWASKEYLPIALMLLGVCGLFQVFFTFIGQYFLAVGNYIAVILIPIGITIALFFGTIIIFEAYAQVERKRVLKTQFSKSKSAISNLRKFLLFPIVRPIIITFPIFTVSFFISFPISNVLLNNTVSFIISENIGAIACLLVANMIEKNYARIQRY